MLKLYYAPGACSISPHIALREAGLSFTLEHVDFKAGKKLADGRPFAEINPKGYVPALGLDDGQVLTEGVAIVQYIADLKPESGLAPAPGTFDRVRLQEWLNSPPMVPIANGPVVAESLAMSIRHIPSLAVLEPGDDDLVNAELWFARLREQVAVVRTLADHIEQLARPGNAGSLSDQLIEEMARLGCRLFEAAASMAQAPLHQRAGGDPFLGPIAHGSA
jgi:hypothetical protein